MLADRCGGDSDGRDGVREHGAGHETPRSGPGKISSTTAQADRKSFFMNGNRIATQLYNYGGISPGYDALRGVNNLVWRNLDYVFQFCPIVGASVPDAGILRGGFTSFLMRSGTIRPSGK